jgi:hypothetical protein
MVECPFCTEGKLGDAKCEECDRDGIIECIADDPASIIDDPEPNDVFELARSIITARERKWIPTEVAAQSAVFVQAYQFFLPMVGRLVEELLERHREQIRKDREMTGGRYQ